MYTCKHEPIVEVYNILSPYDYAIYNKDNDLLKWLEDIIENNKQFNKMPAGYIEGFIDGIDVARSCFANKGIELDWLLEKEKLSVVGRILNWIENKIRLRKKRNREMYIEEDMLLQACSTKKSGKSSSKMKPKPKK